LAKLSVEQALAKAKSHTKKGEVAEAQALYATILKAFPNNKKAQQGLTALGGGQRSAAEQGPPQAVINQLVTLYNQGQLELVIEQAKNLTKQYPASFMLWNILGVANKSLGKVAEATNAFINVTRYNSNFAEGFSNLGVVLEDQGQLDDAMTAHKRAIKLKPAFFEAYNNMGAILRKLGNLEESINSYKKAITLKPNYIEAHNNLGVALAEKGNLREAIASYQQALSHKPDYAEAYSNMGNALKDQGKLEEAIEAYNKALIITPYFADAHYNMGNALKDQDKLEEAIEAYNKALVIKPDYAEAYSNMGVALTDQGKLEGAIEAYNKSLSLKPDYAEAYSNMGVTLADQGKLEEAIEAYNKALVIKPDYAEAYSNMGVALKDQGKLEEAIEAYNKALAIKPDYAEAFNNIGNTLKQQDKLEEAIEAHNKALAIKPEYAEAYSNIGVALKDQGKLEEAIEAYNKALAIKPDYAGAHYNSSFALLNSGRLKEGLDAYEWRWKTAQFKSPRRHFLQPLWDGKTSLQDQRILVWCEQGVGDTIIWSSRLSLLVSQAGHCILECQKKLVPLLSRSFPNVEVKPVDVSRDTERDDFDFHLPMASLYRHFIPEITRSPKPDAFLMPDPGRVKFWKDSLSFLGGGPYVGISWKSSLMGAERSKHFSSLSEWSSLLTLPNINFINLQYADAADGLLQIQNEFGVKVHNFDDLDQYNDLDNVAALSAALDCVVSFGTSVPMITAGVGTLTKCPCLANGNYNNILGGPIGPLVDKFEKNTSEPWSNVFGLIADDISKL
jgi:tetratricopeptide (TPR) repeat protein